MTHVTYKERSELRKTTSDFESQPLQTITKISPTHFLKAIIFTLGLEVQDSRNGEN